ncbi:unnamed protein product [Darwinula stevensoni]|uniref:RING-type domain-containing protein n=1 Tax=Darwinula stevensoni TaxID=69355 RepID=A0A7R8XFR7_9CRUS|nr:unnamed protein product [Darwinula stevensoni]CAG0891828.1 unnamed protein product [Darwinula stevensoni]
MGKEDHVIRMCGLPRSATREEVIQFLAPAKVKGGRDGVHFTVYPNEEAYIEMESQADIEKALKKDNEKMGLRFIQVYATMRCVMAWNLTPQYGGSNYKQDGCIRLKGLPLDCRKEEVVNFFSGLEMVPKGIYLSRKEMGDSYVQFANDDIAEEALKKHRQRMRDRYIIQIFRSSLFMLKAAVGPKMYLTGSLAPNDMEDKFSWVSHLGEHGCIGGTRVPLGSVHPSMDGPPMHARGGASELHPSMGEYSSMGYPTPTSSLYESRPMFNHTSGQSTYSCYPYSEGWNRWGPPGQRDSMMLGQGSRKVVGVPNPLLNSLGHTRHHTVECGPQQFFRQHLQGIKGIFLNNQLSDGMLEKKRLQREKEELEKMMEEERQKNKDMETEIEKIRRSFKQLEVTMETELQCPICNELYVQAVVVDCGHTFCSMCIEIWCKMQQTCPSCRCEVKTYRRLLMLDNYINRLVTNLPDDIQQQRKGLLQEREVSRESQQITVEAEATEDNEEETDAGNDERANEDDHERTNEHR